MRETQNAHAVLAKSQRREFCPVCQSSGRDLFSIRDFPFKECETCKLLYSAEVPPAQVVSELYTSGQSSQEIVYRDISSATALNRQDQLTHPKTEFIDTVRSGMSNGAQRGVWIDIGSGTGDTLVAAMKLGYSVLGFEPDPLQASDARSRGIPTTELVIDPETELPQTVLHEAQIVSLFNVVEHMPLPELTLRHLISALAPGTLVAIEVPRHPSVSSFVNASSIGPIYRHASPPEHLQIFSDDSISILFSRLDLDLIATWHFGSDALELFGCIGPILGWESGFAETNVASAVEALQAAFDLGGLSDNMLVVGRVA